MRTLFRPLLVALVAALTLLTPGCGKKPKLVKVEGKVVFKDAPLTGGSIWFQPDGAKGNTGDKASCQLALDGSFSLRTYPYGAGAMPGAYKVTLAPELASRIGAPNYSQPHTTPLNLDVPDEGLHDVLIEIKATAQPSAAVRPKTSGQPKKK